jgi:hypothetical protein
MSALAGRLSPVIHKALLANGVQLTHKELGPVSKDVADYVATNFDPISEEVKVELAAREKKEAEAKLAAEEAAKPKTGQPVTAGAVPESQPATFAGAAGGWPWGKNKKKKW